MTRNPAAPGKADPEGGGSVGGWRSAVLPFTETFPPAGHLVPWRAPGGGRPQGRGSRHVLGSDRFPLLIGSNYSCKLLFSSGNSALSFVNKISGLITALQASSEGTDGGRSPATSPILSSSPCSGFPAEETGAAEGSGLSKATHKGECSPPSTPAPAATRESAWCHWRGLGALMWSVGEDPAQRTDSAARVTQHSE